MRNRKLIFGLACALLIAPTTTMAQLGFLHALSERSQLASEPATIGAGQSITLPAGTHLLLRLTSALHTTSATPGAGVYLETEFPVIAGEQVAIPRHTRVLGVVENGQRPGRVKGRAQMRMRFTEFILPDERVFAIAGSLQSLPGSTRHRTIDKEGTIEPVDQIDRDVYLVAKTTGVGLLFGSIGHVGVGLGPGAAIGAGLGIAKVLFTRGDEISLPVGTKVEMVLQKPLVMEARHE